MSTSDQIRVLAQTAQIMFAECRRPRPNEVAESVTAFRRGLADEGVDPQAANDSAVRVVNALVWFAEIAVELREAAAEALAAMAQVEELAEDAEKNKESEK